MTASAAVLGLGLTACASTPSQDIDNNSDQNEQVPAHLAPADSADEAASEGDAPVLGGWTSFDLSTGHIRVPVRVAGVDGYAMIDSGAQGNAISDRFDGHGRFKLAKIKSRDILVEGVNGVVQRPVYNRVPVEIGGTTSVMNQLTSLSLGGEDTLLLLGMPLFERAVVQIDYPNKRIRFFDKSAVSLSEPANVKSSVDAGILILNMAFGDNEPVWLTADTGAATGLLLGNALVEDQQLAAGQSVNLVPVADIHKVRAFKTFASNNVRIGPFVLDDVQAAMPADPAQDRYIQEWHNTQDSGRIQSMGLVGYDVLKHFLVTIDLSTNYVRLDVPEEG